MFRSSIPGIYRLQTNLWFFQSFSTKPGGQTLANRQIIHQSPNIDLLQKPRFPRVFQVRHKFDKRRNKKPEDDDVSMMV